MLQAAIPAVYTLPPDKLAKAIALYHARTWAYFGDTAWTILALWALVHLKIGPVIRNLAARPDRQAVPGGPFKPDVGLSGERITAGGPPKPDLGLSGERITPGGPFKPDLGLSGERITPGGPFKPDVGLSGERSPWLQGLIAAPLWLLILTLLGLPVSLLMQRVDLRYGISVEPWSMWWADFGKSLGLTLIFGTITLTVLYALMRHSKRRWWLWFWIIALPVEVAAVFVVPIVIDPMFDHFSPLAKADPALVDQLERVAARGHLHIPPSRMYVMDASAKVTGPNAYVTGFGASKRIVVWDNTLRELPLDDILGTYGHEQGHYVLHHIQKGMLYSAAVMFVFFWIAYRLLRWLTRRFGERWRIPSLDDWSSLGLVLLVVTVLGFFADPVGNAFSRHIEHQADVYGEEVIHGLVPDPQATMAENFQRLGELWLDVPHPNPFIVFWTYSHPPTADRVRFAANYDPWAAGRHPRYVSR